MIEQLVFYVFAVTMIVAATMVILARNPVHSALFLVLTFVGASGLWILLEAEFLALILIIVYVGAVMTLFLFVIMMVRLDFASLKSGLRRYLPIGTFVLAMVVGLMLLALNYDQLGLQRFTVPDHAEAGYSNIHAIGDVLYTDYVYAFEIAAVLLLLAIIAAISLVLRGPQQRRDQQAPKQIFIDRTQRLKIVSMKPEIESGEQAGDKTRS